MLDLIQPAVRDRADELSREFQAATPFRHVVIDEFLAPAFCRELMDAFPAFDRERARNEMGEVGLKAEFPNLPQLGPAYARLDAMLRSREFLAFTSRITGIPDLVYDPAYLGGGTHENLSGQELDVHVDFNLHPATHFHRRLNAILFLNPEWCEQWGGALELHLNPWLPPEQDMVKTVLPLANRCVVFETTERSWHGFKKIVLPEEKKHLSRRSIAVYYYTSQRPKQETAPPHATVYVQRPLPEYIRPGYTLRQEDVETLQSLMVRRDMQIRFLYDREKEFSQIIHGVIYSKHFRLYRALTWPARKCWQWIKARRDR